MVYIGSVYPGCTYHGVHRRVYTQGVLCLSTYHGGIPGVYYASLLYYPGYTLGIHRPPCYLTYTGEATRLRDDDALGSKRRICLGKSL